MNLLDSDNSDQEDNKGNFKINTDYAKRYEVWRKHEELQKLKDRYGDDGDDGSSSTSEEEDENAVELTEDVEKDFFKTLSCLKEKNPLIYDDSVKFFKEKAAVDNATPQSKSKKKEETLTMAAYQRKMLLEKGVQEELDDESAVKSFDDLPIVEQDKALKESFKNVLQDSDSDDDGLLQRKEPTAEEKAKEEADYRKWLAGQDAAVDKEDAKQLKGLRDYWTDPKLDEDEKFLRDFIINHRYLENDEGGRPDNVLSSDSEEEVTKQETFEHKYNFRFEEPDQEFIKSYPRTLEMSMRKKDDRRKRKREEVKARKEAERAKKDEELKRLKALKKSEIMDKINKLKKVTGNEEVPFQEEDIDGDFNPDEHDRRMSQLFNDEFYGAAIDEEKPECPDIDEELEIENWDEWDGTTQDEPHCEDPGFNMDCEYDGTMTTQQELLENSKKRRKRRQSKFAAAASQAKPVFDPKSKSFEQYLEEYYALDYEDLIGDIPCRFKYRKTVPNDFGLTIEEILSAPDKELNKWASVKKIMKRRGDDQELYDVQAYRKKAQNLQKKKMCLPSLYAPPEVVEEEVTVKKKRKRNRKRLSGFEVEDIEPSSKNMKSDAESAEVSKKGRGKVNGEVFDKPTVEGNSVESKKKKKKNKGDSEMLDSKAVRKTLKPVAIMENKASNKESSGLDSKSNNPEKKKKLKSIDLDGESKESKALENKVSNKKVDNESVAKIKVIEKSKKDKKKFKPVTAADTVNVVQSKSVLNKRKKKKKIDGQNLAGESKTVKQSGQQNMAKKFKKTNDKKKSGGLASAKSELGVVSNISDARLKSYGLNPKKFRNKLKYGNKK